MSGADAQKQITQNVENLTKKLTQEVAKDSKQSTSEVMKQRKKLRFYKNKVYKIYKKLTKV